MTPTNQPNEPLQHQSSDPFAPHPFSQRPIFQPDFPPTPNVSKKSVLQIQAAAALLDWHGCMTFSYSHPPTQHTSASCTYTYSHAISVAIALHIYIYVYIAIDIGTMRANWVKLRQVEVVIISTFRHVWRLFDANFCCSVKTKAGKKQSVGVHL